VRRVALVTWLPGGNLPPLLAAAALLAARGHRVSVLASAATRQAAERAGFEVHAYERAPVPDTSVAFEQQLAAAAATAAGLDVALDVRDMLSATHADLAIVDCMLPAGIAGAQAAGTPTASLVHFLYGLARRVLLRGGSSWTTDLRTLERTHRALGLPPPGDGLAAWEAADLLLVTAPRWLDVDVEFPPHIVHAGPLGVNAGPAARTRPRRVLLSFSTTVMEGQHAMIRDACEAVAATGADAILTLGPAVDAGALRLPAAIEAAVWADHDELMRECAAVVTHGGLGTTLRALAHGVPLLMIPLGRDQDSNGARVAALGAGIRVEPAAGPAAMRSALEALLGDPAYAAAAAGLAARIAAERPDDRAAGALERCVAGA
jgi:UDP:flavonoid glycosyltransferase YjiC (YdhE family)